MLLIFKIFYILKKEAYATSSRACYVRRVFIVLPCLQPIPACLSSRAITQILKTKKRQHWIVDISFKEFFWTYSASI